LVFGDAFGAGGVAEGGQVEGFGADYCGVLVVGGRMGRWEDVLMLRLMRLPWVRVSVWLLGNGGLLYVL